MRNRFDEELKVLHQEMVQMGTLVEQRIQDSIEALVKRDIEAARKIMEQDEKVDQMQKTIESICFNLLIQQQPVAKDLRNITAAMKMVTDMERIGDHATDISEITIYLAEKKINSDIDMIVQMAGEALVMLMQSVEAFVEKDVIKAQKVIAMDDTVDKYFEQIKNEIVLLIQKNPQSGEEELDYLMIAKYLERIGDHATNIAEWVIYSLDDRR